MEEMKIHGTRNTSQHRQCIQKASNMLFLFIGRQNKGPTTQQTWRRVEDKGPATVGTREKQRRETKKQIGMTIENSNHIKQGIKITKK